MKAVLKALDGFEKWVEVQRALPMIHIPVMQDVSVRSLWWSDPYEQPSGFGVRIFESQGVWHDSERGEWLVYEEIWTPAAPPKMRWVDGEVTLPTRGITLRDGSTA